MFLQDIRKLFFAELASLDEPDDVMFELCDYLLERFAEGRAYNLLIDEEDDVALCDMFVLLFGVIR